MTNHQKTSRWHKFPQRTRATMSMKSHSRSNHQHQTKDLPKMLFRCRLIQMKIFQYCCEQAQHRPQWEQQQPSQQTQPISLHPEPKTLHGRQRDIVQLNRHAQQENARSLAKGARSRPTKLIHRPRYPRHPFSKHSTTTTTTTTTNITDYVTRTEAQASRRKKYV